MNKEKLVFAISLLISLAILFSMLWIIQKKYEFCFGPQDTTESITINEATSLCPKEEE